MLEISDNEIAYRPPIGKIKRTKFANVISIKKALVGLSFGGMPAIVDGIVLELPNYMTMQIPLDLRDGQQAFDKIKQAWERQHHTPSPG